MATPAGSSEPKKSRFRRTRKPSNGESTAAQFKQVFTTTREHDSMLVPWLAGTFLAVFLLFLLIGFALGHPWILGILGFFLGIIAALLILGRRAQSAAYKSIEGQPGATGAVLTSLKKGWRVEQEPVAVEANRRNPRDINSASMVYRAIGKPGVVLIAEGPKGSALRVLESERKRTARVLGPEVPVHVLRTGNDEEAIPVNRVAKDVQDLPKVLTEDEIEVVTRRLRALGTQRPGVPAGVDPNKARVNRSAMRGR